MTLQTPESLVAPRAVDGPNETAAQRRRAIAGAIATTAAPTTTTAGISTRNHQYLHLVAQARVSGSADVTVWGKFNATDVWTVLKWIGTAGVVAFTSAGGPITITPALIAGIDRVHVQVSARTVAAEVDVWLMGSSF